MSDTLFLAIDVGLAILLLAGILIFLRVNKNLTEMKSGQSEFMQASADLTQAVNTAQQSVQAIKVSAASLQETLGNDIKRARALSDELKLITEAADNLATRIEKTLTDRPKPGAPRDEMAEPDGPGARMPKDAGADDLSTQKEQRALLSALKDAR